MAGLSPTGMAASLAAQPSSPDLFSTNRGRDDPSPPPPKSPHTDKTTGPDSRRYILPNNLRDAVKYLNDEELDSLRAATLEETKRRGRLRPSVLAELERSTFAKRLPLTDKISRRRATVAEVSLTRGQVNAVRAAFKAGVTPARIARQFGISQSNVRKALAGDELKP